MSLFTHIRRYIDQGLVPNRRRVRVQAELLPALEALAALEQRSVDQVAHDLLRQALIQKRQATRVELIWQQLTEREQQVVALTCLGSTNPQIAARIGISINTVKNHISRALNKFGLHSKAALRETMMGWDFNAWA